MLKIVLILDDDTNSSIFPQCRSVPQFLFPIWKSIRQYLIYHVPLVIWPEATTSCNEIFSPAYYTLHCKRCCTCGNINGTLRIWMIFDPTFQAKLIIERNGLCKKTPLFDRFEILCEASMLSWDFTGVWKSMKCRCTFTIWSKT